MRPQGVGLPERRYKLSVTGSHHSVRDRCGRCYPTGLQVRRRCMLSVLPRTPALAALFRITAMPVRASHPPHDVPQLATHLSTGSRSAATAAAKLSQLPQQRQDAQSRLPAGLPRALHPPDLPLPEGRFPKSALLEYFQVTRERTQFAYVDTLARVFCSPRRAHAPLRLDHVFACLPAPARWTSPCSSFGWEGAQVVWPGSAPHCAIL